MVSAGLFVRDELMLQNGEKAGAWNAGALGYILPNKVINLDGLANNEAFFATRKGINIYEYMQQKNIKYLVDVITPEQMEKAGILYTKIWKKPFLDNRWSGYFIYQIK